MALVSRSSSISRTCLVALVAASGWILAESSAHAATITLNDGRILRGRLNEVAGVAEDPLKPRTPAGGVQVKPIVVIDDGLRRTYVPQRHILNSDPKEPRQARIHIDQTVATFGRPVAVVGAPLQITKFDSYGRRIYSMKTVDETLHVVQGITEITPVYTRVEGLMGPDQPVIWDQRIATTSVPREVLTQVLARAIPQDDVQARLSVVQLYLQSEQYRNARLELEQVIKDFPQHADLANEVSELRQMGARRALDEIQLRADAGQHRYIYGLLTDFPADEVAGETLVQVREMVDQYVARQMQIEQIRTELQQLAEALSRDARAPLIGIAVKEISAELSHNNLQHLAAYRQLGQGADASAANKLALAVSGWLVGANYATDNLAVAMSLWEVRDLVRDYLRESTVARRSELLSYLRAKEGGTAEQVARILAQMKPPLDLPPQAEESIDGYYRMSVPGLRENADVTYLVQLPPEYDPHRRYPVIVTLNGSASTVEMQLDFWAGGVQQQEEGENIRGERQGQAMRHGYITLAIEWQKPHQIFYEYSAREHHAVLSAVRRLCRHFSVDTDRIFLSGHDTGGDAAWDIGLAHPDMWAGVLPIVATADQYIARYWPNAEFTSFYFVAGEMDGQRIKTNARDWDRYLRAAFDATLVEYLGRGHEAFHDDIQQMFDWMNRRQREFFPREFECTTMRPWDNFFWWLEVRGLPERSMVHPSDWPPPRNTRPAEVSGRINGAGNLQVDAAGGRATIWLSPELIDFNTRHNIRVNRRTIVRNSSIEPDVAVLLEDARTRGDRKHPFWAKVEGP